MHMPVRYEYSNVQAIAVCARQMAPENSSGFIESGFDV